MKPKIKTKSQDDEWEKYAEYFCKHCKKWYKYKHYDIHKQKCNECSK